MPVPPKLKGLSKRPRKQEPLPDPPEGYMWMGNDLVRIAEIHGKTGLKMHFYDKQPPDMRKRLRGE